MDYITRDMVSNDWITFLLLGCVVLYSVSKYLYPQRFQEFILLPITNKYFLVQGKNNEIQHPFNILLFISQVISVSLLIYLIIKVSSPETVSSNPWIYIQISTAYAAFVLVKYYLEKIVSVIFSLEPLLNQYLYEKITYRNLLSIVVFLGNLVFFFIYEPTLTVLLTFLGIMVIMNVVSIIYSYKTNGKLILRNFFYFILYLCALEISPYFILYKLFIGQGDF
ncbi:MAG: DUF4271 domain-containing protein [Bacteroidia bacterium]|nr:DUF4271 domain-containing protein [Bacteroidia bacterium]NNF32110.1 DUF4271 domain-containing protein [Flavobacteriaceae bacterium]MBT8275149.1 DUF4271 domain-containing protein [Bacteroidia bacterium]NNJ82240.1 DUF4271 domain-containing protein [Flavobacteriaceae bacterium]NNK54974.1 DUF4271 domain-containing protein [Flavobacteriaceae bacterium]